MHEFLSRHFSPGTAATIAILWYVLLIIGIIVFYQKESSLFLYQMI